jgi:hypothetical protein
VIKYTKHFLEKIEDLLTQLGYEIRYEKGNFKAGYCVLKTTKVIVINKYFPLEGRINALAEILKNLVVDETGLNEKQALLLADMK